MYRVHAFRRIAGALVMAIIRAPTTAEALALLTALRAEGWECRPTKEVPSCGG